MSEYSEPAIKLPPGATAAIRAGVYWFGNASSCKIAAAVAIVRGGICAVNEQGERRDAAVRDLAVSSRLGNMPRQLVFPDGTMVSVDDNDAVDALLKQVGGRTPFLHRFESAWKIILPTIAATAIAVGAVLFAGVPMAADFAARQVSHEHLGQLSENTYQYLLKEEILKDSKLPPASQERVRRLFAEVSAPWRNKDNAYNYRVRMHRFPFPAPNAFAFPDGLIVVTDELVTLISDDEMRAVLAHEIGHVEMRHGMRAVFGAAGTGVFLAMLGDVSFLLSGGTALLGLKYSRTHEEEADCFAYRYLRERGMEDNLVGTALQKMEAFEPFSLAKDDAETAEATSEENEDAEFSRKLLEALSTHPRTEARQDLEKSCAA